MAQGITAILKADQSFPDSYINLLSNRKEMTANGAMFLDPERGVLDMFRNDGRIDGSSLKALRDMFKGTCCFQFMDYPKTRLEEDLQPIVLLSGADDQPEVLGMFEGDFSHWHKEKSSHLPFYHFAMEYVFPKIAELNDLVEGDDDKLVKACSTQTFIKDILTNIGSQGSVTLMFGNGDVRQYTKERSVVEYPWGSVTDSLGYELESKKAPAAESKSTLSLAEKMRAKLSSKAADKPAEETPAEEEVVEDQEVETGGDTPTEVPAIPDDWMKNHAGNPASYPLEKDGGPPWSHLDARVANSKVHKIIKLFRRESDGYYPPEHVVEAWAATKGLQPSPAYISKAHQIKFKMEKLKHGLEQKQAAKPAATVEKPVEDTRVSEPVPVIPADAKTRIMKDFMGTVFDTNGNRLKHDEKEAAAQYGRAHPGFTKSFGLKGLSQTYSWFFADRLRLAQDGCCDKCRKANVGYASAILNQELTREILELHKELASLKGKDVQPEVAPASDQPLTLADKLRLKKAAAGK